jgi:S1-C subfamily serine protease
LGERIEDRAFMARGPRGFAVWVLLLAGIVLGLAGVAAWWLFYRLPELTVATPQPVLPDALMQAPAVLQNEIAALKQSNDRLAAGITQAEALLKLDVCDPKRQAELETLLQKIEFGAHLETPPAKIDNAAQVSPAGAAAGGAAALGNEALVQQLKAQTVFILAPLGGGDVMLGSGMVIGPGLVLTNRHVVAGSVDRDLVVMASTQAHPLIGRVKALSAEPIGNAGDYYSDDFALVAVNGPLAAPPLSMARAVQPLDPVIAAGFPTNVITADKQFQDLRAGRAVGMPGVVLSRGDVRAVENQGSQTPVLAHTAEIAEGNSGGPLVNACGQLVGINTFGIQIPGQSRSSNFAIGNGAIDRFLKSQNVALPVGPSCSSDRL